MKKDCVMYAFVSVKRNHIGEDSGFMHPYDKFDNTVRGNEQSRLTECSKKLLWVELNGIGRMVE